MVNGLAKDPEFIRMMEKVKRLNELGEWERPEFDQCGCRIRLKPFWLKGNAVQNFRVLVGQNLRVSLVTVAGVTSCVFRLYCSEQPESLRLFVFKPDHVASDPSSDVVSENDALPSPAQLSQGGAVRSMRLASCEMLLAGNGHVHHS